MHGISVLTYNLVARFVVFNMLHLENYCNLKTFLDIIALLSSLEPLKLSGSNVESFSPNITDLRKLVLCLSFQRHCECLVSLTALLRRQTSLCRTHASNIDCYLNHVLNLHSFLELAVRCDKHKVVKKIRVPIGKRCWRIWDKSGRGFDRMRERCRYERTGL